MRFRKNIKEKISQSTPETNERVSPDESSATVSKIKKSVAKNLKNAVCGLGLMAGASNAMACTTTEYVAASVDANIDVGKTPELTEKGPILSNSIFDAKTILKGVDQVFEELGERDLHAGQFLDSSNFQNNLDLKYFPETTVVKNLAQTGQKKQLIYYEKKEGDGNSIISFKTPNQDHDVMIILFKERMNFSVFDKGELGRTLNFDYGRSGKKGGFVQIYDEKNDFEKFISADGQIMIHENFIHHFENKPGQWKDGVTGKLLSIQTPAELKNSASLIGHNGLLNKYIIESANPSWKPKNLESLMMAIKNLPSNNPLAYMTILDGVVMYRPDPNNNVDYQFRNPNSTLAEGYGDCDDYVIFALIWAKANGFKARVAWFYAEEGNGHVITRLKNPKTGEVFVVDNNNVSVGETSYQATVNEYTQKAGWTFHEEEKF